MVVYGHGIQYLMGDGYVFWDNRIFQVIYSFHMGLFMMISGYFFFPFSQKYGFLEGISRKVNTILIPCLTWGGGIYIVALLRRESGLGIRDILMCEIWHNWFLWAVFFCSIGMMICIRFIKYYPIAALLIVVTGFFFPDYPNLLGYKIMFPCFFVGFVLKKHQVMQWIVNHKKFGLLISGLVFLLYCIFMRFIISVEDIRMWQCFNLGDLNEFIHLFKRWVINLIGSLLFMIVFAVGSERISGWLGSILSNLGKNTLGIYMTHLFFFESIRPTAIYARDSWTSTGKEIYILVCSCIITAICFYLVKLIQRNKYLARVLLGIAPKKQ